jgi:hypothetical protein
MVNLLEKLKITLNHLIYEREKTFPIKIWRKKNGNKI